MDSITLKNFRCFREEQTARLAPLTLLVGENSTGKTSFMAMIRALWDVAYRRTDPDFKEEPYDLGSFDEIAHHRGGRAGRASTFQVGFSATRGVEGGKNAATPSPYRFDITFERQGPAATPTSRRFSRDDAWVEEDLQYDEWPPRLSLGTPNGAWMGEVDPELEHEAWPFDVHPGTMENTHGTEAPTTTDWEQLRRLSQTANKVKLFGRRSQRPYASAPVRSKPRRTYDPSRPTPDPEGDYVPMYLAEVFLQDKREWKGLKNALEAFGRQSGLFDEISVKSFGTKGSEPFQVQVRKFSEKVKGAKGPRRNLIDVGYGVSQVLPVIIELVRPFPRCGPAPPAGPGARTGGSWPWRRAGRCRPGTFPACTCRAGIPRSGRGTASVPGPARPAAGPHGPSPAPGPSIGNSVFNASTWSRARMSGAILIYLAEKSGRLLPEHTAARMEVMNWLFFAAGLTTHTGLGPSASDREPSNASVPSWSQPVKGRLALWEVSGPSVPDSGQAQDDHDGWVVQNDSRGEGNAQNPQAAWNCTPWLTGCGPTGSCRCPSRLSVTPVAQPPVSSSRVPTRYVRAAPSASTVPA